MGGDRSTGKTQNTLYEEIITTHVNADFDALASMLAASKLHPEATLVFPGSQEKSLRDFFLHSLSYLFNFIKPKHIDLEVVKRLIIVDTRQKSRIGKFAKLLEKSNVEVIIYDHHPDSDDDIHGDVEVIQRLGSNAALLSALIREKGITLSSDEATILCLGIHEDTGSFTYSSTTPEDYREAAWLTEQGAKHNIVSDVLTKELSSEQVHLLSDLAESATTTSINGVDIVITKVIRDEYMGDFAVLVQKYMDMENLDVVFALAQMEDRVYMVARSRIREVNVAEIALSLGGGGHPQASSATIKHKTLIQVEQSLQKLLRDHINPIDRAGDMMSSPVISVSPEDTIKKAGTLMTGYNINVLLVVDESSSLQGYITREVAEKAMFYGLQEIKVKEYMNFEYATVGPRASLREVQELIIRDRLRVLPVVENQKILGVITRTDLLNILVGDTEHPETVQSPGYEPRVRKKNAEDILDERLPPGITSRLRECGHVADTLGFNAYLVGGLVRDLLLRRQNLDVDIVIEGDGIRFAREFAKHYGTKVRSHRKFGTAVIIFPDNFKMDVATARTEYYEFPGSPPIVETSSLKLDLYRRDFTINTLAIKLNKAHYGTLIDYFGAQKDIKNKVLRVLHNLSFVEDPTRVFRAVRFEQRFGFKIGKLTLSLIRNAIKINCFKDVSGKRLFLELKLILKEEDPVKAIERMHELDLLQFVSPKIQLTQELQSLLEEIRGVIAWYNLLYIEGPFEPWKVYYHGLTSNLHYRDLKAMANRMEMVDQESQGMLFQRKYVKRLMDKLFRFKDDYYSLYKLLESYDTETLLYVMARSNNEKVRRQISTYFTQLKGTRIELGGKDLLYMGFEPGPIFREIFDRLLEARINGAIRTKEDEIRFVEQAFCASSQDLSIRDQGNCKLLDEEKSWKKKES